MANQYIHNKKSFAEAKLFSGFEKQPIQGRFGSPNGTTSPAGAVTPTLPFAGCFF